MKQLFHKRMGSYFIHYRLLYTLFAAVSFISILWYQVNLTSPALFKGLLAPKIIGMWMIIVGLGIMLVCIRKYFMNLSGLRSLVRPDNTANQLIVSGIHRYVRHPLYLGTFIFIWGLWLVFPLLSLLIANCIITVYTLIGINFEEQKLEQEFGESYRQYKQQVPKIIPFK